MEVHPGPDHHTSAVEGFATLYITHTSVGRSPHRRHTCTRPSFLCRQKRDSSENSTFCHSCLFHLECPRHHCSLRLWWSGVMAGTFLALRDRKPPIRRRFRTIWSDILCRPGCRTSAWIVFAVTKRHLAAIPTILRSVLAAVTLGRPLLARSLTSAVSR